jgi:hypothetical protein
VAEAARRVAGFGSTTKTVKYVAPIFGATSNVATVLIETIVVAGIKKLTEVKPTVMIVYVVTVNVSTDVKILVAKAFETVVTVGLVNVTVLLSNTVVNPRRILSSQSVTVVLTYEVVASFR